MHDAQRCAREAADFGHRHKPAVEVGRRSGVKLATIALDVLAPIARDRRELFDGQAEVDIL